MKELEVEKEIRKQSSTRWIVLLLVCFSTV